MLTSFSINEHRRGTGWKVVCCGAKEPEKGTCASDRGLLGRDPFLGCSMALSLGLQNDWKWALGSMHREVINSGKGRKPIKQSVLSGAAAPTPLTQIHPCLSPCLSS